MIYNIMYHYVRNDTKSYPYFRNLTIEQFRTQLGYFLKYLPIISLENFIDAVDNKPNTGIILTFDDGLKDHYKYVLPELVKRKMWGFFYIPTRILLNKKILPVHKIHLLIGKYPSQDMFKKAINMINKSMLDEKYINTFDKEIYRNQLNNKTEYLFKRLFNYYLKTKYRDVILDDIFSNNFDEKEIFDNLYLSIKEIKEIERLGNVIGSHGINHKVLSKLSRKKQEKEIKDSFKHLEKYFKLPVKSFCYPYGLESTYNKDTINILKQENVHHAFVIGNRPMKFNKPIKKYSIPRYDCNQF